MEETQSGRSPTKDRLLSLDILRALAVISVLFAHVQTPDSTPPLIARILSSLKRGGWIGVDLFFVLSGFLVSSLLFKEYERFGKLRPGRFLIRRGLKIYPAFYAMLILTVAYGVLKWRPVTVKPFLAEALFVQNYFPFVWGHTWSLAIEEHFYLLLTLILYLLARRGLENSMTGKETFRTIIPLYFGVATFCLVARGVTYWAAVSAHKPAYFTRTHLRVDELLLGVLLSYLWAFDGERLRASINRHRRWLGWAVSGAVPLFFFEFNQGVMGTIGFLFLSLTFGALLLLTLTRETSLTGAGKLLGRIGVASYSIYLWHVPWLVAVPHIMNRIGVPADAWPVPLLTYFVGSIAMGVSAAALIELPALRLRDRLFPSRTGKAINSAEDDVITSGPPFVGDVKSQVVAV